MAFLLFFTGSPAGAQDKADIEAIHKLIDQYAKAEETGNLMDQARLMSADRVVIEVLIALQPII